VHTASITRVMVIITLMMVIFTLMMEAVGTSETSVYSNETTQRYIQEGCHLDLTND
jgi:hypothetical protein